MLVKGQVPIRKERLLLRSVESQGFLLPNADLYQKTSAEVNGDYERDSHLSQRFRDLVQPATYNYKFDKVRHRQDDYDLYGSEEEGDEAPSKTLFLKHQLKRDLERHSTGRRNTVRSPTSSPAPREEEAQYPWGYYTQDSRTPPPPVQKPELEDEAAFLFFDEKATGLENQHRDDQVIRGSLYSE